MDVWGVGGSGFLESFRLPGPRGWGEGGGGGTGCTKRTVSEGGDPDLVARVDETASLGEVAQQRELDLVAARRAQAVTHYRNGCIIKAPSTIEEVMQRRKERA